MVVVVVTFMDPSSCGFLISFTVWVSVSLWQWKVDVGLLYSISHPSKNPWTKVLFPGSLYCNKNIFPKRGKYTGNYWPLTDRVTVYASVSGRVPGHAGVPWDYVWRHFHSWNCLSWKIDCRVSLLWGSSCHVGKAYQERIGMEQKKWKVMEI